MSNAPTTNAPEMSEGCSAPEASPAECLGEHVREYARQHPELVALWCLGAGFILGWKLKPW